MNQVLNYLWEASLCLGALWFFYRGLLDGNTFFDWNRAFMLLAMIASLLIPAIEFLANLTGTQLAASYSFQFPTLEFTDQKNLSTEQEWVSLPQFLFGVYLIGLIFFLSRLIWGMFVLYRQICKARQAF